MAGTKGQHGGKRPGAGRPANSTVLARTAPSLLADLEGRLIDSAPRAAAALDRLLDEPDANPAQVAAARYILDRALGRPRSALDPLQQEMLAIQIREARLRVLLLEREAEGKGLSLGEDSYDPLGEL